LGLKAESLGEEAVIAHARNQIAIVVAGITLILSTAGFLLGAYALGVIGLIGGGISFGLLLGEQKADD
jgi:hypothetical protein